MNAPLDSIARYEAELAEKTPARRARDAERNQHDYAHTHLTLSCGCRWSFVAWRYQNECAAHYVPQPVIGSCGDRFDDAFKARQSERTDSAYGD